MVYNERKQDLFRVQESFYLAHCISRDCKMGAGIAVAFQKKFDLRDQLLSQRRSNPDCIRVGRVFNLITKERYWHKPTLESVREAVEKMRDIALQENIKHIAMPRIASGLDRLDWNEVRAIIIDVFNGTGIHIFVCTQ
jgi:O-acetyl-ADP-ribose deacetylase (regulator of RNase III)